MDIIEVELGSESSINVDIIEKAQENNEAIVEVLLGEESSLNIDIMENPNTAFIEVYWQDEVELNYDIDVQFIKNGQKEIDTYVVEVVKPDILEYSKVESRKYIDSYVSQTVEDYVDEVTKPSISEYANNKIDEFDQNATAKTDSFNILVGSSTAEYQDLAQTSEETLIQYVDSASLSAKNAKDSADISTAQASISTAQAVISTTKASESLASANASANSAINAENSAKASAKSLSDANQVLANTISQKDIAVSSANSAKESETKAKASETNAKASENNAKFSEVSAKTSETNAKTSETNASQSATKSAQSEANALTYSQNAESSADSASNSVVECQAIKDSLGTVYKFKGSVASVSALPSGASIGDVYDVTESGNNYAWTGSSWDSLGVNVDLSEYAKKSDLTSKQDKLTAGTGISIDNNVISNTQTSAEWGNIQGTLSNQTDLQNALNNKQNTLVSGTNIKTINGESLLGGGDVEITGRNVGDIFYTSRIDTELNGAVECNGGTYNTDDFSGKQSIGTLLSGGSLPYVSLEEYANLVSSNGSCRAFGWDGGASFRVPLLNNVYIEAGNAESVGEFISESLPNIEGTFNMINHNPSSHAYTGAFTKALVGNMPVSGLGAGTSWKEGWGNVTECFDASNSNSTYQDGAKVKPDSVRYRAMVQLAIKTTDDAVITVTSGLQQIANKAENDLSNLSIDGVNYINDTINNIITERDNKYDYTAVVTKSTNTDYTAEFTGLLWCYGQEGNGTRAITINGARFNWCYHYGSGYSSGEVQVPLHKGDKFRVGSTDSGSNIYFIPAK